ncbi:3-carboxyethylcatechol 2,3-dioxygenase [Micromonospora inositola]|uniref:2,3-dihydroxyphenylpropionate 1,2-dioxygenase n=1 Tax=Micromonospora inositola TaxID=47865 RepID=A0A1C5K565_9ACTN|nr:3-carboxyethylcatechol 2,3-dioxygenase [Micromonospora inositola]SCG77928.1 2,3-dihydroxyphenylpropionate 1,2-dioxygenase [Micromonospora inositola]
MVVCASHSPLMHGRSDVGQVFRAGLDRVREDVRRFGPELVVFFGPDHRRAFTDTVPAITVVESAHGYGDWGTVEEAYRVPSDHARSLATALMAARFDVAVANRLPLDHGFGQTATQLFGSLSAVPILPVVINCVARPLPGLARVADLGRAVDAHVRTIGCRVLYVASGGLSHAPPSLAPTVQTLSEEQRRRLIETGLAAAAERIAPDWDERFLRLLGTGDLDQLARMDDDDIEVAGNGAHEVRTWVAAAAAGGVPVPTVAYEPVPEWITGMAVASAHG